MNSEDKYISFERMEAAIYKELYKKTPLKKRPIQPYSLSSDEEMNSPEPGAVKISPEPGACAVPEVRLSKRKMLKPTKRFIESYVKSTAVLEPVQKAMCVPLIKTSAEANTSSPVEMNEAVDTAQAIPELEETAPVKKKQPRTRICRSQYTELEWGDFNYAVIVQKGDLNLRSSCRKENAPDLKMKLKHEKSPVKAKDKPAGSVKSNPSSSSEMPNEVGKKQGKQKMKKQPKQASVNIGKIEKDTFTDESWYSY